MRRKLFTLFLTLIMTVAMTATVFADDLVTINVTDPPQVGVINVLLEKNYKEKSTRPLSGAIFEIKHYPNVAGTTSGNPIHTWRFETTDLGGGKYGIKGSDPTRVGGDSLIPYGSYKHVWPLGTYTIQEISPPVSYIKTEEIVTFRVSYNANGGQFDATVTGPSKPGTADTAEFKNRGVDLIDDDIWGHAHLVKKDKDNNEASPEGDAALSGIKFALVLRSQSEYVLKDDIDRLVQEGEVVKILTTDANGGAELRNLRYGTYELIELRKDSRVEEGDIYNNVSAKYGSSIYANDTGYKFNSQRATKELKVMDETVSFDFSDPVVRGGIHVSKKDIEADNQQGDATLAGIRFAIVNRSANKVRVNDVNYNNGQVVYIMTTNETGDARTSDSLLPYGTYDVIELRADSGIAVGDVYDSSSGKYGTSIYANSTGAAGVQDRNHGSMLFNDFRERVTIRHEKEMVGDGTRLSDTGSNETFTDNRVRPKNRVVRGGFEAYKVDKETMISYPLEGASLYGIEFTLKNASEKRVYVNGKFYEPGAVIPDPKFTKNANDEYVWITDAKGWIGCDSQYLPYGTYTLQETKTNDTYHLTDRNPHEFTVRTEKQITGKDDDSFIRTKEEAQALKAKWVGGGYAKGDLVFPNQVKRGPLRFHKEES